MENNKSQPRLTKKGLPDKRAESSKKNLEKGKSLIKQALQKIKEKPKQEQPKLEVIYSSDEYSTDEEEVILKDVKISSVNEVKVKKDPIPSLERKDTHVYDPLPKITKDLSHDEEYSFTFEKKLEDKIKELNDIYGIKISTIENENNLTKAELKAIKEQNQALKKTMTSNFRTHAGVMNQEMYLKF